MKPLITKRQKETLSIIYNYIKDTGYPPTFEEMRELLGVSSNQSVIDLLVKLEKNKVIRRNESTARGIVILPLAYEILEKPPLTAFLGVASAGVPTEAIEIQGQWQSVSDDLVKLVDQVFILKIKGDSMINAGINDGDAVLVKSDKEFVSGDIVLARVGSESTVKRFISEDKPPYLYLKPENPKYDIIYFTEDVILEGKVVSILKSGQWKEVM